MATLSIIEPALYLAGTEKEPDVSSLPFSGAAIFRGDFTIFASGTLQRAATNQAGTLAGLARHGSADIYFTGIGGAAAVTDTALFGASVANTSLMPAEPTNLHVDNFHNLQPIEICQIQSWATSLVGTTSGIKIDTGTNLFVSDNTQTNKPLTITGVVDGPSRGTVGDVNKRVLVTIAAANLAY